MNYNVYIYIHRIMYVEHDTTMYKDLVFDICYEQSAFPENGLISSWVCVFCFMAYLVGLKWWSFRGSLGWTATPRYRGVFCWLEDVRWALMCWNWGRCTHCRCSFWYDFSFSILAPGKSPGTGQPKMAKVLEIKGVVQKIGGTKINPLVFMGFSHHMFCSNGNTILRWTVNPEF